MTEENKNAAAEATTTQEISTETTPAQETATTTTETTEQSTPTTETKVEETENWEYNGDRKAIPKPFEKYVKGLDRYVSKKDQAIAEARKKAEEYDKFTSSEQYKAYQQFIANQTPAAGRAVPQEPVVTQDEIDAISLGDAKTLEKVIDRAVQRKLESTIGPKEQEMTKQLQAVAMKQKELESAEMIQAFADVNPDFWELYDSGFEDYIVTAVKSGRSLEDAYKGAKMIEAKQAERLEAQRKANFEKKKAGSVVGKSITGTPDVVYADNEDHAKRLAIELTLKGDKRHVRIKPKN